MWPWTRYGEEGNNARRLKRMENSFGEHVLCAVVAHTGGVDEQQIGFIRWLYTGINNNNGDNNNSTSVCADTHTQNSNNSSQHHQKIR